jgi:hypothetical protein
MHKKVIFVFIVLFFSVSKAQYKIELWNQIELTFQSSNCYENPFVDVDFFATFTSEKGDVISRPAFGTEAMFGKSVLHQRQLENGILSFQEKC